MLAPRAPRSAQSRGLGLESPRAPGVSAPTSPLTSSSSPLCSLYISLGLSLPTWILLSSFSLSISLCSSLSLCLSLAVSVSRCLRPSPSLHPPLTLSGGCSAGSCQAQREGQGTVRGQVRTAINLSLRLQPGKQQGPGKVRGRQSLDTRHLGQG